MKQQEKILEEVKNVMGDINVWAKLPPGFSEVEYGRIGEVLVEANVDAAVATNTAASTTSSRIVSAGVSGWLLHDMAVKAVKCLQKTHPELPVVACGGAMDGKSFTDFIEAGSSAVQYYSALVFRGPKAGGMMLHEANRLSA